MTIVFIIHGRGYVIVLFLLFVRLDFILCLVSLRKQYSSHTPEGKLR